MKTKNPIAKQIAKDGISYNNKQIKKLETEIKKWQTARKKFVVDKISATVRGIDEIINHHKKRIEKYNNENKKLKKRL